VSVSADNIDFNWQHPNEDDLNVLVLGKDVTLASNQEISVPLK